MSWLFSFLDTWLSSPGLWFDGQLISRRCLEQQDPLLSYLQLVLQEPHLASKLEVLLLQPVDHLKGFQQRGLRSGFPAAGSAGWGRVASAIDSMGRRRPTGRCLVMFLPRSPTVAAAPQPE